jgi:predicted RNA-binding protein with PUA-like domain
MDSPHHWLMKTEPGTFAWSDLVERGTDPWDGVRNAQARNHLRSMTVGDLALIYHSGDERRIVGVARVASLPYPDSTSDDPRWVMVDVEPLQALPRSVTLADVKADPVLSTLAIVRQPRLSVAPVTLEQFERILKMGGIDEG